MDTEFTDIQLFQRITNRDSKALETLYDRYSPVLYTLVKRIVVQKEIAEEILADIFVIIWQKSSMFDINSGNLFTWLITLTRNKALDFVKRKKFLITDEYNDDYENDVIIPNLSLIIPANDLDKTFNNRENIFAAVHNLTEAQQYVLSLAYYDGLSESDIATKLNIPLLTVKSKIRVALNSVKEILAKEGIQ
ncbi:MAG: sigma-70 family RNA polymerase sigma factor [Ignavibacteriales bacterium]|nr:sigma-70 family RNA polymerase sigma factor [Ignavibacteriales bacterium]MBK7632095.1 sigma-70 family RNA polymerase sigma factor [Ignavibacteriales bacterium]